MSALEETDLHAAFASQEKELKRAMGHLQSKSFLETMQLLISWMGTDQAKRMNDFWDERGGI